MVMGGTGEARCRWGAHEDEDAVADALEQYHAVVTEIGAALATTRMRPPFQAPRSISPHYLW
jgi:hypothetical protein